LEIGEIADLVDHKKTGAGIVTQAPAQGGIAVERGEVAEQLTGADEQHGVTGRRRLLIAGEGSGSLVLIPAGSDAFSTIRR
jgi:hypothetical protein